MVMKHDFRVTLRHMTVSDALLGLILNYVGRCHQGDQIGRIFTQWVIVYFGQFLVNYKNSPDLCATFPLSIDNVLILTKIVLGFTLWTIFLQTNLVTLVVMQQCATQKSCFMPKKPFEVDDSDSDLLMALLLEVDNLDSHLLKAC
jgi:hypothetical protein